MFYKINKESIAIVREDLVKDYQALVDHHSEEILQLLEEFSESHIDIVHDLQAYETEHKRAAQGDGAETIVLPDNDSNEHALEGPAHTTPLPPQDETSKYECPKEPSPQNPRTEANPDVSEAPREETHDEDTRIEEPLNSQS